MIREQHHLNQLAYERWLDVAQLHYCLDQAEAHGKHELSDLVHLYGAEYLFRELAHSLMNFSSRSGKSDD